jgi:hypothetical protein
MTARFEVLVNGERVCLSGVDGDGVLSATVDYVKHAKKHPTYTLHVGALGRFNASSDRQDHANWLTPSVGIGDEITIRILPGGDFDDPAGMTRHPARTMEDPVLGRLNYHVSAWDGDIAYDRPPLAEAHIHLVAGDSGPSEQQRCAIQELIRRHTDVWPEVSAALIRCHTNIKTVDDLNTRIDPRIGINMYGDSDTLELTYRFRGDPGQKAYFVKLRDWRVVEICAVD